MKTKKIFTKIFCITLCGLFISSCGNDKKQEGTGTSLYPDEINESALSSIANYETLNKIRCEISISKKVDNADYKSEGDDTIASSLIPEIGKLGELKAVGDELDVFEFEGKNGVSSYGTVLGFTYLQDVKEKFTVGEREFSMVDSTQTELNSHPLGNKMGNGALIILKSFDKENWSREAVVTSTNRAYVTYFPSADDVKRGVYLKFINSVQFSFYSCTITTKSGTTMRKKKKEVPQYTIFNVTQEINAVVARNTSGIKFLCESVENTSINIDGLDEKEAKIIQNATSMTDGSTSTTYINAVIDETSSTSFSYQFVGKDDSYSATITSTQKFTKPGKYTFTITSFFGTVKTVTLYLMDKGEDMGFSQFFGSGVVDGTRRVFDATKTVPTFMVGKQFNIIQIPEYLPARYGNVYYYANETAIQNQEFEILKTFEGSREVYSDVMLRQGFYMFDFYNCDPSISSGDILHYSLIYYASQNTLYAPSVNYSLITNAARSNILATKVLSVALSTTGGGAYHFIYPYTEVYMQQAYELAVEIEELSVEIVEKNKEKHYFYKSAENPNVKVSYSNKTSLYEVINQYADKNVSVVYLENDMPFADKIVPTEDLTDILSRSLRNSVRVVESNEVLRDLRTGDIYLNDYKFAQVADFEVDSVSGIGEDETLYSIPFNTDLDTKFSKSEKIVITEKNWNGSKSYETIYSKNNTCIITAKEAKNTISINSSKDGNHISTTSFKFMSATDKYDSQTLIAVNNGSRRDVFSMDEITGLSLPKGKSEIEVINRNGQTYSFEVECLVGPTEEEETVNNFDHDPLRSKVINHEVNDDTVAKKTITLTYLIFFIIIGAVALGTFITAFLIAKAIFD